VLDIHISGVEYNVNNIFLSFKRKQEDGVLLLSLVYM
jgi:hypothetical protein